MIMAGGIGDRLQPLTKGRCKAAVPFAGKYRLIDFTLNNCINSGMRQIFILTQYKSGSLHRHIQDGWGISSSGLGEYIYCIPAQQKLGENWYRGTGDAVRQNLDLIKSREIAEILILSGDHVCKMNYLQLLHYHRIRKAGLTVSAIRVRSEDAANKLGVIEVDQDHRIIGFEEKPARPKTLADAPNYALASMGIYVFTDSALRKALRGRESDFGNDIIPKMMNSGYDIFAYDYEKENKIADFLVEVKDGKRKRILVDRAADSSYWKDVGTIDSYYEASMDLVGVDPLFNLYGERWPLRTYHRDLPPTKCILGGSMPESMVSDGCIISGGTVWRSILSPGVVVERDSVVGESVVLDDVIIEPNAMIKRAIIDKEVRIHVGASIGYDLKADRARGCTISDTGIVVVPKGIQVRAI